ncbi:MAG TPA: hypothetical protein VJM08_12500 [Anaerolineales bacterium]|nr:hypothetical protein [Anaerolineales bacterium]
MAQNLINQSKPTEWIRAVIGASLSAFIVGIMLLLFTFNQTLSSAPTFYLYVALDLPGIFLHTWLLGDPFAKLLSPADALAGSWRIIYLTLVYWFFAGFGITYFIKDTKKAIQAWLSMMAILAVLSIFLS